MAKYYIYVHMDICSIRAVLEKTDKGYILRPVTKADQVLLNTFAQSEGYIEARLRSTRKSHSYNQVKTVWALVSCIYESMNGSKPTASDARQTYEDLLEVFAEKRPSRLHPEELVPIHLSSMNIGQASRFIQALMNILSQSCDLDIKMGTQVNELFIQWQEHQNSLKDDPNDYDKDGSLLSLEDFRLTHLVSLASGLGGELDMAHIISRSEAPELSGYAWNVMMLKREEHRKQHEVGWEEFIKIFPHIKGRVERARLKAREALNG